MAFTFDPTTARGRVRLLIADTNAADATLQIFDDAEIDAFLVMENGEVYGAAAAACESLASSAARSAVRYKAEKLFEVDRRDMPTHFRMMAEAFRKRMVDGAPHEEIDSFEFRTGAFGGDASEYVGDIW